LHKLTSASLAFQKRQGMEDHHPLYRPAGCADSWWDLILECTHMDLWQRPTLPQILVELQKILATA